MEIVDVKAHWNENMYQKEKEIWGLEPSDAAKKMISFFEGKDIKNKKILDMGCGYGRDTRYFSELGLVAMGIDFAEEGIKLATNYESNAKFSVGDVQNVPFGDNEFDICFCNCVVHWFTNEERKKAINEAYRVTKNGGLVVFCIPEFGITNEVDCIFSYNGTVYTKSDVPEDFKNFEKVRIENITEHHEHEEPHEHNIYMIYAIKVTAEPN